jgi:hypothetical protein
MITIVYNMGMDRFGCEKEKKPTPMRNNRRKTEISQIRGELWSLGQQCHKASREEKLWLVITKELIQKQANTLRKAERHFA